MLKNTLQKNQKMILSKDNLTMNQNIMPKLYIILFYFYKNNSNHKNDDP